MTNDKGQMTKIIAHRGASAFAPENTLAAFTRAIEVGAEGIEFDVRLAKDGVAVIHHDPDLERTAGRKENLADLTSEELSAIDVGSWFESFAPKRWMPEYARERVPTLTDTLSHLSQFTGVLYIELKCSGGESEIEALADTVCKVIREKAPIGPVIVQSFQLRAISYLRRSFPEIRTAALFEPTRRTVLRKEKYILELAAESGADELSIHYSLMTKRLMRKAKERRLPVTIWTADHPRWIKRAIDLRAKAVITNDPARLLTKRAQLYNPNAVRRRLN